MIIERHKLDPESDLAKALDAENLSNYATMELPEDRLIVECKKKYPEPVPEGELYPVSVIIEVAKQLYGGDRKSELY